MKKIVALIALSIMSCLIALKSVPGAEPVISDISIILDYYDPTQTLSTAVLDETLKTMSSGCSHLFLNKKLWLACISNTYLMHLDTHGQAELRNQWNCYDTQKGLLYFSYKESENTLGIKVDTFKQIDPFDTHAINNTKDDLNWPAHFDTLFDLQACAHYSNAQNKIVVYMNGHGTPRAHDIAYELACGISTPQFAQLLSFFNDTLHISLLGVQSCHWTAERIKEIMIQHAKISPISFTILTPLSTEEGLWLDTVSSYLSKKSNGISCFFDCCCDIIESEMHIDNIRQLVYNTDTLKLTENKAQKATLITANSNQLLVI